MAKQFKEQEEEKLPGSFLLVFKENGPYADVYKRVKQQMKDERRTSAHQMFMLLIERGLETS